LHPLSIAWPPCRLLPLHISSIPTRFLTLSSLFLSLSVAHFALFEPHEQIAIDREFFSCCLRYSIQHAHTDIRRNIHTHTHTHTHPHGALKSLNACLFFILHILYVYDTICMCICIYFWHCRKSAKNDKFKFKQQHLRLSLVTAIERFKF